MNLNMSFRQAARMNTPRGCSAQGKVRTPHPQGSSSRTKVFSGLTLVEWHLERGELAEAKALMARIEAGEVAA